MDFPPLFPAAIDVVAECEDVVIFVNDFIGLSARAVETPAKGMLRIGLIPSVLLRAGDHFGNP